MRRFINLAGVIPKVHFNSALWAMAGAESTANTFRIIKEDRSLNQTERVDITNFNAGPTSLT